MSAIAKTAVWISPEEYLEGERLSEVRHEYVDGSVYAMAGASADHNRIAGNAFTELSNRLRGGPCEAFIHDMKVKVPRSNVFYYPDVVVACDPADSADYFRERPSLIVEVLSRETERTDRREKHLAYTEIPTLNYYIMLRQDRVSATVFRRTQAGWEREEVEGANGALKLPEMNIEIPLGRIYERTSAAKSDKP